LPLSPFQPRSWSGFLLARLADAYDAGIYVRMAAHIMKNHHITARSADLPKGIAFEIDDLRHLQEWAVKKVPR
jgi:hypothetical protein